MRKRYAPPSLSVRFEMEPVGCWRGWFAHIDVWCKFKSCNGQVYELKADLKATTAIELTDYLLNPRRVTADFRDTPSERHRISQLLANQLKALTARQPEWFKQRGYPVHFRTYKKPTPRGGQGKKANAAR